MTLPTVVRFGSLMSSALSTGVLFGTRVSLGPSTQAFGYPTYRDVQQATVRNLRPVMATLLPGAVMANVALVGLSAREGRPPALALTTVALASQVTALVLTAVFELPINARVLSWSAEDPPAGWELTRDRWARVHTLRTAAAVIGLGCLVGSATLAPRSPR